MESKHLTDEEIQDYLDGNTDRDKSPAAEHMRSCSLCRRNLAQYGSLYSGLSHDPGFELSVDFADKVVTSVGLDKRSNFVYRHADVFLSIVGAVAAFAAVYYFTDIARVIAGGSWFGWLGSIFNAKAVADVKDFASSAGNIAGLIVSGVLALVTIWVVDRFMVRSKRSPSSLVI